MTLLSARTPAACLERQKIILAVLRKLGAATIIDIADEIHCNRETCRRYVNFLVEAGKVVLVVQATAHGRGMFSLADIDESREFDERHLVVKTWPAGQFRRDPMVAALFGAAAVRP